MSETETLTLEGFASITDIWYEVGFYEELIAAGAFKRTLNNPALDVALLVNHAGLQLARTVSGTLQLTERDRGLWVVAGLDPSDPDVRALEPKMRRGDVTEMSFAFKAIEQEWDEDYTRRTIRSLDIHRGDVSIVSYGANAVTSSQIRSRELLGEGKATQRDISLAERERRAHEIGKRVVGAGSITALDGTRIARRAPHTPTRPAPVPDYTKRARLRLAAIRAGETRGRP